MPLRRIVPIVRFTCDFPYAMTQAHLPGWSFEASPFHRGERAAQARTGMQEKMETIGRRVIRNFMPDQHRDFFSQLPFLVIGSVDHEGQPWASVLAGHPGFVSSPDAQHLH